MPRTSTSESKPVATRLDAHTRARAEAVATQLGVTMSGLLSVALSAYLERQELLSALAEITDAAAEVRDAAELLSARDAGLAARVDALTEALKSAASEAV